MSDICDVYFDQTVLLLHFDGTQGQTTYTDSSGYANPVSTYVIGTNTAIIDTTTFEFGGGSLYNPNPGSNDSSFVQVLIGSGGPLDITDGDFTLEFWSNQIAYGGDPFMSITCGTGDPVTAVMLAAYTSGGPSYTFEVWNGLGYSGVSIAVGSPWHAFAIVRHGTSMLFYLDGSLQTTLTGLGAWSSLGGGQICIGGGYFTNNYLAQSMFGYLDEIRLTKGVARYTGSSYTVQSAEWPAAQCPFLLPVFVPARAFKAVLIANADGIFPQAYLPQIDSTARVTPQRIQT